MLWPVFHAFFWPFSVFQYKSSFSRSGVIVFTVINNSRSIVFQTKGCCIYSCYLWYSCISACNELWNTRQAREKSKSSMPEAKNTSFVRVPFQKIMYRQMHEPSWFIPLNYRSRGFVIGGIFRLKNVIYITKFNIMRKFDWLKKRALWEYKHGAKRFFFFWIRK